MTTVDNGEHVISRTSSRLHTDAELNDGKKQDKFKRSLASRQASVTYKAPPNAFTANLEPPARNKVKEFFYNPSDKSCCGRTLNSWFLFIAYTLAYLMFLTVFTGLILYVSIEIIIASSDQFITTKPSTLDDDGVGLSATPRGVDNSPVIWYKKGDVNQIKRYTSQIDQLFEKRDRNKREVELGECGVPPYGYGEHPCFFIRINKQIGWSAKPLREESDEFELAPKTVQEWSKSGKRKFWLHCISLESGEVNNSEKSNIKYYPSPPGIDADAYPINMTSYSPIIAVQILDLNVGATMNVQCHLWYEGGPSKISVVLYVTAAV